MSLMSYLEPAKRKRLLAGISAFCLIALIGVGVMAKNGWLPSTDALSGKKTGWFGKELPKNAGSTWNPLAAPLPTATPQLSKEYIYAGSRLLAVEDANANVAPLVSVSGRVTTNEGRGLTGALVKLTDPQNVTRTVVTSRLGAYQFDGVQSYVTYTVSVSSRRFTFIPSSQQVNVTTTLTNVDFTAQP